MADFAQTIPAAILNLSKTWTAAYSVLNNKYCDSMEKNSRLKAELADAKGRPRSLSPRSRNVEFRSSLVNIRRLEDGEGPIAKVMFQMRNDDDTEEYSANEDEDEAHWQSRKSAEAIEKLKKLKEALLVKYTRISLKHKKLNERITIDFDISFSLILRSLSTP